MPADREYGKPSRREYGETFLTKPRWHTENARRAKWSPFQWAGFALGPWHLSLLGVINGPLSWTRFVLVCHTNDETFEVERYSLKRRWW